LADSILRSQSPSSSQQGGSPASVLGQGQEEDTGPVAVTRETSDIDGSAVPDSFMPKGDSSSPMLDNDEALDALCALKFSDFARFTHEQLKAEQSNITDDEQASVLSDMFGRHCSLETRKRKRAKRNVDNETIEFLLCQMKLELERTPNHKKQALLEAQQKCRADEFSDARLEKFLRSEGLNAEVRGHVF
jgi:hypothetical protein